MADVAVLLVTVSHAVTMSPGTIGDGLGVRFRRREEGRRVFFLGREDGERHDTYYNPYQLFIKVLIANFMPFIGVLLGAVVT